MNECGLVQYCPTPPTKRKYLVGMLWMCNCGKVWRLTKKMGRDTYFLRWEPTDIKETKGQSYV